MNNRFSFFNCSQYHTDFDCRTFSNTISCNKIPFFFCINRCCSLSRQKERTFVFEHCLERTLNTVIDCTDKTRTEFKRQWSFCTFNVFSNLHTGIIFINLNYGFAFILADDFTNKFIFSYINYIVKTTAFKAVSVNDRTCDACNFTVNHSGSLPPNKVTANSFLYLSINSVITSSRVRRIFTALSSETRITPS